MIVNWLNPSISMDVLFAEPIYIFQILNLIQIERGEQLGKVKYVINHSYTQFVLKLDTCNC